MPPKKANGKSKLLPATATKKVAVPKKSSEVPKETQDNTVTEEKNEKQKKSNAEIPVVPAETRKKKTVDEILSEVLDNPNKLMDVNDYNVEEIQQMLKTLNPYRFAAKCATNNGKKRSIAVSYLNMKDSWFEKFEATAMLAFLFQIAKEWEVPKELRRWIPDTKKDEKDSRTEIYSDLEEQKTLLEGTYAIINKAIEAKQTLEKTKQELADVSIKAVQAQTIHFSYVKDKADPKTIEEALKEFNELSKKETQLKLRLLAEEGKYAGLQYALSRAHIKQGKDAEKRFDAIVDYNMKFPETRAILTSAGITKSQIGAVEMPEPIAKKIVQNFVSSWFKYDPIAHVRSAYDKESVESKIAKDAEGNETDNADPDRLTLKTLSSKAPKPKSGDIEALEKISSDKHSRNAALCVLRDPELCSAVRHAIDNRDAFRRYLSPLAETAKMSLENIPPQDTYHRFKYFKEQNYEDLLSATTAIYHEKRDLDWALGVWDYFEGNDKEINAQFSNFCQKNEDDMPSSIKLIDFGGWTLLGDFKENREKAQFYNKYTEVLKRILDRHEKDASLGRKLMEKRIEKEKAKNIREAGPDAPGLSAYKKENNSLGKMGAQAVISAEQMKRLERARGDQKAAKELEFIDGLDAKIAEMDAIRQHRPLNKQEESDYEDMKRRRKDAEEMLEVPDDAIQVHVLETDTTENKMTKRVAYLPAEAPTHTAELREEHNRDMRQMMGDSTHPLLMQQLTAPKVPKSYDIMAPTVPMAPYAAALMDQIDREKTEDEKKQEAIADHDAIAEYEENKKQRALLAAPRKEGADKNSAQGMSD